MSGLDSHRQYVPFIFFEKERKLVLQAMLLMNIDHKYEVIIGL